MGKQVTVCIVCHAPLVHYFDKDFEGKWSLDKVTYWRCPGCGLTIARTLYDMTQQEWEHLNSSYHTSLFKLKYDTGDLRWRMRSRGISRLHAQARTITLLHSRGLLKRRLPWVDYGCGNGLLADDLTERQLFTWKFDHYIRCTDYLNVEELGQKFSVVINTCVFEHIRKRSVLDEIAGLVADDGVLALHTLVRDHIPQDPNWFYLLPVHCTMFTNDSMQRLFEQWGFVVSLYHVPSRMWFWFRKNTADVKRFMESKPLGFHMQEAFVDYWR